MKESFQLLKLNDELTQNLNELKYQTMTPIQALSLPIILEGNDIIAQAKTGSGKTAAFGLGLLNSLQVKNSKVQKLVICPTRELAEQVAAELRRLARMTKNIKILTVTGGVSEYHQIKSLSHGAHIIVGTPGRLLKHIRMKRLLLKTVDTLVLDEADRMLDMGFSEDISEITSHIPKSRQTLLFSATFPDQILKLGEELGKNAKIIKVDTDHNEDIIEQIFFQVHTHKEKQEALHKILNFYLPERFIIFCRTKQISDFVAKKLSAANIYAKAIHGDLMQNERTNVLTMFANHSLSALVATDVAARGLDIEDLELVINYDLPSNADVYTHRIGRTARAGKKGQAINLYTEDEVEKFEAIADSQNVKDEYFIYKKITELESKPSYDLVPTMSTIYISGGKKDKLRPGDIVGAIVAECKLDFKFIGKISITPITSFVAIKSEYVDNVIKSLNAGKIKNKKYKIGLIE